jgi:hypothetical protein
MADKPSKVQSLLRSNPTLKADLIRSVKDVLKKHGVEDQDMNVVAGASIVAGDGGDFVITKSDGKKNDTTVYFP